MFEMLAAPSGIGTSPYHKPIPAIYRQATEDLHLPLFGKSGTGGIENYEFQALRRGYQIWCVQILVLPTPVPTEISYSKLMEEVKVGFGRTISYLPAVFGVSRQTLYNWLGGETPKEQNQEKIIQLAAAARVFSEASFKLTGVLLERKISQGKSLVELIGEGANGKETAERLIKIEERGKGARNKLEAMLGNRKPSRLDVSDMGRPAFQEDL